MFICVSPSKVQVTATLCSIAEYKHLSTAAKCSSLEGQCVRRSTTNLDVNMYSPACTFCTVKNPFSYKSTKKQNRWPTKSKGTYHCAIGESTRLFAFADEALGLNLFFFYQSI